MVNLRYGRRVGESKALPQLEELRLDHTEVTDAGILRLSELSNLKHLLVHGTKVTPLGEGTAEALPGCVISDE